MTVGLMPSPTQQELRKACAQCGHSLSFHGKQHGIACRAMGCRGGQGHQRCEGFATREVAIPVFLAPALSA